MVVGLTKGQHSKGALHVPWALYVYSVHGQHDLLGLQPDLNKMARAHGQGLSKPGLACGPSHLTPAVLTVFDSLKHSSECFLLPVMIAGPVKLPESPRDDDRGSTPCS